MRSTTDEQTTSFANAILSIFGAGVDDHPFLLLVVRGVSLPCFFISHHPLSSYSTITLYGEKLANKTQICLGLNVLCNVIMWALFTRALTAAPSTTKVSITNTSANFLVTAFLGMAVFQEKVAGLWWLGAAMLAAGGILVGMREESA